MITPYTENELIEKGWTINVEGNDETYVTHPELEEIRNELNEAIETNSNAITDLRGLSEANQSAITDLQNIEAITEQAITDLQEANELNQTAITDLQGANEITQSTLEAMQATIVSLTERLEAIEADGLKFDANNNVQLRDGTKILALTENENGTFTSRELIGMNKYYLRDENGVETETFIYASELGNMHVNTTLNTKDNLAVDTEHGREYVQYQSNGGKSILYGDLTNVGTSIEFTTGLLRINVTRITQTEIGALVSMSDNSAITLPITRRLSGGNTEETTRVQLQVPPGGTTFDQVTIGQFILGEYWITYDGAKYYIVVGSDGVNAEDLSSAWVEIYEGFINAQP